MSVRIASLANGHQISLHICPDVDVAAWDLLRAEENVPTETTRTVDPDRVLAAVGSGTVKGHLAVWSHPLSKSSETWAKEKGRRARARRAVWRNIFAYGLMCEEGLKTKRVIFRGLRGVLIYPRSAFPGVFLPSLPLRESLFKPGIVAPSHSNTLRATQSGSFTTGSLMGSSINSRSCRTVGRGLQFIPSSRLQYF
jgi:hypothetical protein